MNNPIKIRNSADVTEIDIEGTIGVPEEWQFDEPRQRVATYEKFRDTLARIEHITAGRVIVNIRSTGGDVNDALLIHDALSGLPAHITTRCYGYVASAATIIAQAASDGAREISSNALYLIHNSICATEGNATQISEQIELLHQTDARLADLYAARSGRDRTAFVALMAENEGKGRWLSPEEVLAAGLADTLINPAEVAEDEEVAEKSPEERQPDKEIPAKEVKSPSADTSAKAATPLRRSWERIVELFTPKHTPAPHPLPEDRNVLHFGAPAEVAFSAAQLRYTATAVASREDPAMGDPRRTANEEAYATDIESFRR